MVQTNKKGEPSTIVKDQQPKHNISTKSSKSFVDMDFTDGGESVSNPANSLIM